MQSVKVGTSASLRLFDASSILLLAKRCPEQTSSILQNQLRLDLTIYEIGNAIWKMDKLIDKTEKTTALSDIEQAYDMTALMDVRRVNEVEEVLAVMDLAYDWRLTYYDSCYLYVASKMGITLVSEDQDIIKVARKINVKCISAVDCIIVA